MEPRSIFELPGLFTAQEKYEGGVPPAYLFGCGYRWIAFQVQNDQKLYTPDTKPWKDAGFQCGAWGVSYSPDAFVRDSNLLISQASRAGCDKFIITDIEECLKDAPKKDLDGLFGEFSFYGGPKGLSTLGAAWGENVHPIDYAAFLKNGFDIMPQAYKAFSLAYDFAHCLDHAVRAGVPLDRVHLTIDATPEFQDPPYGMGRPQTPLEILSDLQAAGYLTPDISVYLAEAMTKEFADTMKGITMQRASGQMGSGIQLPTDSSGTRALMQKLGHDQIERWKKAGLSAKKISEQRVTHATELLDLKDSQWIARRSKIQSAIEG